MVRGQDGTCGRRTAQRFCGWLPHSLCLGVAAGVATLVIALAMNSGFRETLQDRLLGVTAHISSRPARLWRNPRLRSAGREICRNRRV